MCCIKLTIARILVFAALLSVLCMVNLSMAVIYEYFKLVPDDAVADVPAQWIVS